MSRLHIPFRGPAGPARTRDECESLGEEFTRFSDESRWFFLPTKIRAIGGRVELAGRRFEISLESFGPDEFVIWKSPLASPNSGRVQAAMSVAHHLLHYRDEVSSSPEKYGMQVPNDKEHPHYPSRELIRETLWFAQGALTPREEVARRVMPDMTTEQRVREVVNEFMITEPFARARLSSMGLLKNIPVDNPGMT